MQYWYRRKSDENDGDAHYDVRKYSFTPRIVNTWNSLPDYVVNVGSVEVFKKIV